MHEITLKLEQNSSVPMYEQIYRHIAAEILSGRIKKGERLPSKRELCAHLKISPSTAVSAYELLCAEGYVRSAQRSGYFVEEVEPLIGANRPQNVAKIKQRKERPLYDFSTGGFDTAAFPYASWAKISREIVYQKPWLLEKGEGKGDAELRNSVTEFLTTYRGVRCDPSQVIIGAGIDYLLDIAVRLLPKETIYALEDPGYRAAYRTMEKYGLNYREIPLDSEGMSEQALRNSGANVAFLTPSHQFPMGITMPAGRRSKLLAWAKECGGRYIVEDDYDSEFRYTVRPIPAMQGQDSNAVIYVGTFSRSIAPSIRVAYMVLPEKLSRQYDIRFGDLSCTVSRYEQHTLYAFINSGMYSRHLRRSGNLYRTKRDILLEHLSQLPGVSLSGQEAGLHFLLTHHSMSESEILSACRLQGIELAGLSRYCHRIAPMPSTVVIGYAGLEAGQVKLAAKRLEEALCGGVKA